MILSHVEDGNVLPQNVLITGGAGCIGSDLAQTLLEQGRRVVVLDNLSSGKREHVTALCGNRHFRFVQGDLLDGDALENALSNVDIVFHLAANADVQWREGQGTQLDLQQNVVATHKLLEAMRSSSVKQLAFASSSAVYGIPRILPVPESHPLRPISLYGASKVAAEGLISAFHHMFGFRCWMFRFANIIGANVRRTGRTVISDFICKLSSNPKRLDILGNGRQAKSYLTNAECIAGMLYGIEHAKDGCAVFNVGSEDTISVLEIADLVCNALGLNNVEYRCGDTEAGWRGDVPKCQLDISLMKRLGWTTQVSSRQAVLLAIQGHLARFVS